MISGQWSVVGTIGHWSRPLPTAHCPLTITPSPLHAIIVSTIQREGPIPVATFMRLALYHPEHGYYASRAQRSGRAGDFYTSVDLGPFFGEMLARQFAEMMGLLGEPDIDLVEAGAGNGRLTRDVLDGLQQEWPAHYERTRVHLVEQGERARRAQRETLGPHAQRLVSIGTEVPSGVRGIVYANELLDALPVHVLEGSAAGSREIYVDWNGTRLVERRGPLSTPALLRHVRTPEAPLAPGCRVEIGLAAAQWIADTASRLARGFLLLIDYGDRTDRLRGAGHPAGTLRAFREHRVSAQWLEQPGEQDLTSHVDFTAIERAGREAGLTWLGRIDQARFLLALGALERLQAGEARLPPAAALRRRLAVKSLLVPGGVGSTHSVLVFGKNTGRPVLSGLALGGDR